MGDSDVWVDGFDSVSHYEIRSEARMIEKQLHPRSRGYSMNPSSLQGSSDRCIMRVAPVVYYVMLGHVPSNPVQLAQFSLKSIQHGLADTISCDIWNESKRATSRRNTLAASRRSDADWRVKNGRSMQMFLNPFSDSWNEETLTKMQAK
eukprot:7951724-Pyramimonas_sp.AAC.1